MKAHRNTEESRIREGGRAWFDLFEVTPVRLLAIVDAKDGLELGLRKPAPLEKTHVLGKSTREREEVVPLQGTPQQASTNDCRESTHPLQPGTGQSQVEESREVDGAALGEHERLVSESEIVFFSTHSKGRMLVEQREIGLLSPGY